jgi:hypothetical protein
MINHVIGHKQMALYFSHGGERCLVSNAASLYLFHYHFFAETGKVLFLQ